MTQINVWVGAFFVLSGYVAGYTATELNKYEAGARVKPAAAYTVARVAGFYPLFLLVNVLFGAMFIFADAAYNGGLATAFHGFLSATLTQAWFPAHAEIWNAPTWFLSALTFAMVALPHALPWVASLRRSGLVKLLLALTAASLIPKLAYSYDLNVWSILEGVTPPKAHPNQLLWNVTRFHPFYALLEVLIGVAAARLVMVDGGERALLSRWRSVCRVLRLVAAFHVVRRRLLLLLLLASFLILTNKRPNMPQHYTHTHKQTNTNKPTVDDDSKPRAEKPAAPAPAWPAAVGLLALTAARAAGYLPLNDPLTRCLLFIPLFTLLVMRIHRNTVAGAKGFTALLGTRPLTYLGTISFPIFVLHGAIGQVFYKKIVATKLWGGVMPQSFFPAYCAVVLLSAVAVQHLFLENKKVQEISASITKKITAAL